MKILVALWLAVLCGNGICSDLQQAQLQNTILNISKNLGEVSIGEKLSYEYEIINVWGSDFVITDIIMTCKCVSVEIAKVPIKVNHSRKLLIKYDTSGIPGATNQLISINGMLGDRPASINVKTSFAIRAPIIIDGPVNIDFGKVKQGGSRPSQEISISMHPKEKEKIFKLS